jgi:hypothetical protein
MLYKFRSKATADLILLGPDGDRMLRLLGREPAAQGIVEVAALAAAIAALEAALQQDEAAADSDDGDDAGPDASDEAADKPAAVSLQRRLWPVIEMFKQAQAQGEPVVWGA